MNEEMKYFAEELEEFLRKGHKLLNKVGQNMGQRRSGGQGYGNRNGQGYGNREDGGRGAETWENVTTGTTHVLCN